MALLARKFKAHAVGIFVFEEELVAFWLGTAEEVDGAFAIMAGYLFSKVGLLQDHSFLGLLAVWTHSQSPVDVAAFLEAHIGVECFA